MLVTDRVQTAGLTLRVFTPAEYQQLTEQGFFRHDERIELIEGVIVQMASMGLAHSWSVVRLTTFLGAHLPPNTLLWSQVPIRFACSQPEPDVAIVRADIDDAALPGPADVLLLVEVAESSLAFDRGEKKRIYAEAGIAVYLVVDCIHDLIEEYRGPVDGVYPDPAVYRRGDSIRLDALGDVVLPVDDVLRKKR